jgi:hypothetical protein
MLPEILGFFEAIRGDTRIGPIHISLYMAIIQKWNMCNYCNPVRIYRQELMQLAKIYSLTTYHRCIRELNEFGYIHYKPSCSSFRGNLIYLSKSFEACPLK